MNNTYALINHQLTPYQDAMMHISDMSVQRGYGIFDFFKVVDGKPLFLEDHLDRFCHSAQRMHLDTGCSTDDLRSMIETLLNKNELPESGVRLTLTGGYSTDGYSISQPNLIITQQPLHLEREVQERGIRLITYEHQRQLPDVKTIDYLMAVWLQPLVKSHGADDVLYHSNGLVTECPRSNFFMVTEAGELVTPVSNVLQGVSRKQLLQLASREFETAERDFTLDDIMQAREAFVSSTTKMVLPVTELNGITIGNGSCGPVTRRVHELFADLCFRRK